jgi:hypothetical protein
MNERALTPSTKTPIGWIVVGRTTYQVFGLPVGDNTRRAGVLAHYALVGPGGASYFVTDYGPGYLINSIACGSVTVGRRPAPAPRPLRGLTREHLTQFLDREVIKSQ